MRSSSTITPPNGLLTVDGTMSRRESGDSTLGGPDDLFCCLLCIQTFRNPRLLECQHAFCEQCLQVYYRTYQNEKFEQTGCFIPCPTCQKLTKVPLNGLAGLSFNQNDEKLVQLGRKMSTCNMGMAQKCDVCIFRSRFEEAEFYCNKCCLNLCNECKIAHNDNHLLQGHSVIHISTKETINLYCDRHNKLPMTFFCQGCNQPACTVCIMHDHQTHHTLKLTDALILRRDNIKALLNDLGPALDKTEAKLKKLSYLNSYQLSSATKNGLSRSTSEVVPPKFDAPIEKRKLSMFDKPNIEATKVERELQVFHVQLERVKKLYDLATKVLEMSQSKKLLAIYEEIVYRLSSTCEVEINHITSALETLIHDKEDLMSEIIQQSHGSSPSNGITAEHTNSLSSTDDSSSLEDMVFDKPAQSLLIRPNLIWKEEKQRRDPGELWNPCDIAFLPQGSVVVAEYDIINERNNRLRVFDAAGKTTRIIGQNQIKPLGVTVTREGNIAVTCCKSKRIKIFSPGGHLMNEWGKGQFGWPYGITCNSKGQFIVTDAFNDSVSIHNHDGKRVRQFGSSGGGHDQFRNPYHVTVDKNDNIIISDCGNHAFKVFNTEGNFLFKSGEISRHSEYIFENKRKRGRKLRAPRGITVDLRGNIIVADDNCRVCMFDCEGKYLRNILTDEDSVKFPEALATNSLGNLAVTEWNPHNMFSVKVFNLYE